jgi:hypothetical protein
MAGTSRSAGDTSCFSAGITIGEGPVPRCGVKNGWPDAKTEEMITTSTAEANAKKNFFVLINASYSVRSLFQPKFPAEILRSRKHFSWGVLHPFSSNLQNGFLLYHLLRGEKILHCLPL